MSAGALIGPLAISGSNTNTGTPNAGGSFFAYIPGTTTQTTIYSDAAATVAVTQPVTLDNAGRIPYATYPNGIYTAGPIRLFVLAADGTTIISDTVFQANAGSVGVSNASFTATTLDGVLTAAGASFGGQDFKYKESGSATARLVQDKFREIGISVKDYGAVGDGLTIDTTAIQVAINRVIALNGGVVYFPPGNYKIDAALAVSAATGVVLAGAGRIATTITQSGGFDALDLAGTSSCAIKDMSVAGNITWSGTTSLPVMDSVDVTAGTGSSMASATNGIIINCVLEGTTRGLLLTDSLGITIVGGIITNVASAATGLEIAGATGQVAVFGTGFQADLVGVKFASTSTGHGFSFVGCPNLASATTPIDISAISTDPIIYQAGNLIDSFLYSAAVGNTLSIKLSNGYSPVLKAASGGAGVITVDAPVPTPIASLGPAPMLYTTHVNGAGGAVTWTMNALFVLAGGVAIPTTDGHTILMAWRWDYATSKWREQSRSDTTT